jgi:hypothetical protein
VRPEDKVDYCSINEIGAGVLSITSTAQQPPAKQVPPSFWAVINTWGYKYMWEQLHIVGNNKWIEGALEDNCCIVVTDGLHLRELYPQLNLAAFGFKCPRGSGRLMGSFVESTPAACSYRRELVGLMAIHLILLKINECNKELQGSIHIYSNCRGALKKVKDLPPYQIPTQCIHSGILKNIMVNFVAIGYSWLESCF